MSDAWDIKPLIGVGPILLGMTRDEVARLEPILGEVYAYDKVEMPSGKVYFKESRDLESPIITFEEGRVVEINLDWRNRFAVFYKELSVFENSSRDLLGLLERDNGRAWTGLGLVLFEKLSINTSGFFRASKTGEGGKYWDDLRDPSIDRTVSVCIKDHFLPYLEHYKEISFLE